VENHDAEISAGKLREWFSTDFLTPAISTALRILPPSCGITAASPIRYTPSRRVAISAIGSFFSLQAAGSISRR
jgi:hypothetical protein